MEILKPSTRQLLKQFANDVKTFGKHQSLIEWEQKRKRQVIGGQDFIFYFACNFSSRFHFYGKFTDRIFGPDDRKTPAAFMSAVSMTYILMAQEGFRLSARVGYPVGIFFAILLLMAYALQLSKWKHTDPEVKANWTEVASRKKRRENQ